MEKTYTIRPVRAEQFIAANQPWPSGVTADASCITGYVFTDDNGAKSMIRSGDYLMRTPTARVVVQQAEFEALYQ